MLNPILFTERVVQDFLRYQLTASPFADKGLYAQVHELLNLDEIRRSQLLRDMFLSSPDGDALQHPETLRLAD
jgi:hypothetical protein